MKTVNINAMNRMDHADLKDLGSGGEATRKKVRIGIIKNFLRWAKKDMPRWNNLSQRSDERIAINRQKSFFKMLMCFGAFSNFAVYQAFLTGIYNYRYHELLNMRKVPVVLKLTLSTSLTGFMCFQLYNNHLYDEDLYRVALKYRPEYDNKY
jgi:hypothetical protein